MAGRRLRTVRVNTAGLVSGFRLDTSYPARRLAASIGPMGCFEALRKLIHIKARTTALPRIGLGRS
jgi:hypothetical protein